jgi:hypothetical protein
MKLAELIEMPIMLAIQLCLGTVDLAVPSEPSSRLGMGCLALGLLLTTEFTLVLWLRGLSIREYFASRDPVSGTVCYVMLGVFAVVPLLVARS